MRFEALLNSVPRSIAGLGRHSGFLRDLKALLSVTDEQFERVMVALDGAEGLLGPKRLVTLVAAEVAEESPREGLINCAGNFSRLRLDDDDPATFVDRSLPQIVGSIKPETFSDDELLRASSRLARLLTPLPALDLYTKAEAVAARTGGALNSFGLTCDIRPVFDNDVIAGVIPITTLTMSYEIGDRTAIAEVALTAADLDEIEAEVARARVKIAQIRSLIEATRLASTES